MFNISYLGLASLPLIVRTNVTTRFPTSNSNLSGMDGIKIYPVDFFERDSNEAAKSRPINLSGFDFFLVNNNASNDFESSMDETTAEIVESKTLQRPRNNFFLPLLAWIILWGYLVFKLGWHGLTIWVGGAISTLIVLSDATGWTVVASMALPSILQLVFNHLTKDFTTEDVLSIDSKFVPHEVGDEKIFSIKLGLMFWVVAVTSTIGVLIILSIASPTFMSASPTRIILLVLAIQGVVLIFAMTALATIFRIHSIKIGRVSKGVLTHVKKRNHSGERSFLAILIYVPVSRFEGFDIGIRSFPIEF